MIRRTVALLLSVTACAGPQRAHPTTTPPTPTSPATTPAGDVPADLLNPAVTQATITATICTAGWTATIRPPTSVTGPIKVRQMVAYSLPPGTPAKEDHVVPLELGGAPAAPVNLFPEPLGVAQQDDQQENTLRRLVCNGTLPLAAARGQVLALKRAHGYDAAKSAVTP